MIGKPRRRPPNAGKGRKAGIPNKVTADVKEMIEGALSDLGGRAWLTKAARKKPAAFMVLVGKLIPRDLKVSGEVRHTLEQMIVSSFATDTRDAPPGSRPN